MVLAIIAISLESKWHSVRFSVGQMKGLIALGISFCP
jgi:hypothetical protein